MTRGRHGTTRLGPGLLLGTLLAAAATAGCGTTPDLATPGGDHVEPPATTRPGTAGAPAAGGFDAHVLPLLRERCSPCHFPGGSMHDRLPFDHEGTVRDLGRQLFTRIQDEEGRALLEAFLDAPPSGGS